MFRQTLMSLSLAGLMGCAAGAELQNPFRGGTAQAQAEQAQMAAFAATAEYPRGEASDDLRAAALINRDGGTIRVINFTDEPIRNARVWVNGAFVQEVGTIPPNGSVTLRNDRFFNSDGQTLAQMNTAPVRVELQSDDKLHRLQGPVYE